jgi:hypothetical protein
MEIPMADDDRVNRPQEQQRTLKQDEQQQKRRGERETGREPPRDPRITDPERDDAAPVGDDSRA